MAATPHEKVVEATVSSAEEQSGGHYEEGLGDLQVLKLPGSHDVKLAKDGVTVLIPQPSDDPNDPVCDDTR